MVGHIGLGVTFHWRWQSANASSSLKGCGQYISCTAGKTKDVSHSCVGSSWQQALVHNRRCNLNAAMQPSVAEDLPGLQPP